MTNDLGIAVGILSLVIAFCAISVRAHLRGHDQREHCYRCRDTIQRLANAWRRIGTKKMPG
jgi:hypothetical protein